MCRALQILCVASGRPSLQALKKAAVAQEWELTAGATDAGEALEQIARRRAHILVTWGAFADLVREARAAHPGLRTIAVGRTPIQEADVNVSSIKQVRDAILRIPPRGGPVGS